MKKWILLLALCASLGAVLVQYHEGSRLESFKPNFLTITFAITTFAVMFSMAAFNSSAYRQFHQSFSGRLLSACVVVLFIALAPFCVLVIWPSMYITSCLLLLPILTISGIGLLEIARKETDPLTLLDRLCSLKLIQLHLFLLAPKIDGKIGETKNLELTKRGERPDHEFDWHLAVQPQKDDPLNQLATLGLLAIKQGDLHTFSSVMQRSMEALDLVEGFILKKKTDNDYRIKEELGETVFGVLRRMTLALQNDKGSASLCRAAIDVLAEFAVSKVKGCRQTQGNVYSAIRLMETLAIHCYENGSPSEIRIPIIVIRQIVQKGVTNPPARPEGKDTPIEIFEFHHALPQLLRCIKRLGSYAIKKQDSEFVYRCFDAFGWLGCAAVKECDHGVGTECVRALCQLGREMRVASLECFWSHCPVRPEDHAVERLDWILTWLVSLTEEEQKTWVGILECGYSRYYGKEISIQFGPDQAGKPGVTKVFSEKNHIEDYFMRAGGRRVDYSDFSFLKDLELHEGKGIMMEGPIVPLGN